MRTQPNASVLIWSAETLAALLNALLQEHTVSNVRTGGGDQERRWHGEDFPRWRREKKSLFIFSHSDSLWMRWIILSTPVRGLPKHCELPSNYDSFFQRTSKVFSCIGPFCLTGKEKTGQRTGAGYVREGERDRERERAFRCYCCFILLTQLGKQPTLALSIQAHGLQAWPEAFGPYQRVR